jgi:hypothetical protein
MKKLYGTITKTCATKGKTMSKGIPTSGLCSKNEGPYTGILFDEKVKMKTPKGKVRTFRILIYQAFNAMGLIGSEMNGVLILDVDFKKVICDEIEKQSSGYNGASAAQVEMAENLVKMGWTMFVKFVNGHPRARFHLIEDA